MTTLMRVQEAARAASRHVGGPARAVFMAFIDALEDEILKEEIEANNQLKEAHGTATQRRE
jgi:hypothetical protein